VNLTSSSRKRAPHSGQTVRFEYVDGQIMSQVTPKGGAEVSELVQDPPLIRALWSMLLGRR
jgi:hypothetical protein